MINDKLSCFKTKIYVDIYMYYFTLGFKDEHLGLDSCFEDQPLLIGGGGGVGCDLPSNKTEWIIECIDYNK